MALDRLATLLSDGEMTALDMTWHLLDGRRTQTLHHNLAARYAPTTTNRMLAALRGVLKEAWQSGLMDVSSYHQAVAIANVPWFTTPRGRILTDEEVHLLFAACSRDGTPAGVRDAAVLTALFGGGLRRSEAVALDVQDYDSQSGALTVRSTRGNRERTVYATGGSAQAFERWVVVRGVEAGPLFVPVNKAQKILLRNERMNDQSVYKMLSKRGKQAGVTELSPQDLRRTFIARLLDKGVDIATVQRLAGHCSVATTQRYDRRSEVSQRDLARMLDIPDDAEG